MQLISTQKLGICWASLRMFKELASGHHLNIPQKPCRHFLSWSIPLFHSFSRLFVHHWRKLAASVI